MPATDEDEIPGAVEIDKSGQPVQPPKKKRGRPPGSKNKPKQPAPVNAAAPSPAVVPAVPSPPPVSGQPPVQASASVPPPAPVQPAAPVPAPKPLAARRRG